VLLRRIGMGCVPLLLGLVALREPRIAWGAPKLIRRVKGVTGTVRVPSSSSMACSSIESELVDRLARRRRAEGVVGEVPERPSVVTESLRRWSAAAPETRGVGKGAVEGCATELFRKRLVKALEVMDPRRCRAMSFELALAVEVPLSEDMMKETGRTRKVASLYRDCRVSQRSAGRKGGLSQSGSGFGRLGCRADSYVSQIAIVREARMGCLGGLGGGGGETFKWVVVWGNRTMLRGCNAGMEAAPGCGFFFIERHLCPSQCDRQPLVR
jgi:hypothetical protein